MGLEKILVIDCQVSGVAGDMILGALVDLGANVDKITSALKSLEKPEYGYQKIKIDIKQTDKMSENQQLAFVKEHFSRQ